MKDINQLTEYPKIIRKSIDDLMEFYFIKS